MWWHFYIGPSLYKVLCLKLSWCFSSGQHFSVPVIITDHLGGDLCFHRFDGTRYRPGDRNRLFNIHGRLTFSVAAKLHAGTVWRNRSLWWHEDVPGCELFIDTFIGVIFVGIWSWWNWYSSIQDILNILQQLWDNATCLEIFCLWEENIEISVL